MALSPSPYPHLTVPELHEGIQRAHVYRPSPDDEYVLMVAMCNLYRPAPHVAQAIWDAYHDEAWDWRSCDGCSGVNECHSPPGVRFPPCVLHDYGCWLADRAVNWPDAILTRQYFDHLFREAMLEFRVTVTKAWVRFIAVRMYWWAWGMWRNLIERAIHRCK